jgi:hypothetical protein
MNDDQSSRNSPNQIRPEGTGGMLSEIAMMHQQSTSYYREIAQTINGKNEAAAGLFNELADYHDVMLGKLNGIIADMNAGVHTPSSTSETALKHKEATLNRAIQNNNIVELTAIAKENEEEIGEAYQTALGDRKVLDFAEEILHDQHQRILTWINRIDRYHTVPQKRNEHYE